MTQTTLSIIICTYNRAQMLSGAIERVFDAAQSTNLLTIIELVIVNNNSDDDTAIVAQNYKEKSPVKFVYAEEPQQGVSHARNRGIAVASGDYLAYIDDECRITSKWLEQAIQIIDTEGPEMLGGPYIAVFDSPPPEWVHQSYFQRDFNNIKTQQYLDSEQGLLSGGNMIIRRDIFDKIGGFDTALGMKGNTPGYGEETCFQKKLRHAYPDAGILYVPDMAIEHITLAHKFTFSWLFRSAIGKGRRKGARKAEKAGVASLPYFVLYIGYYSLRFCMRMGVRVWLRDRKKYPYIMNYFFECGRKELRNLGYGMYMVKKALGR